MQISAIILGILFIGWITWWRRKRRIDAAGVTALPEGYRAILGNKVNFYQAFDEAAKEAFELRMLHFLSRVRITGVNTEIEDEDRILIAASAVIPIFGFTNWDYINLHEVLLYPESFNESFDLQDIERPVLGMVGNGAMQHVMILSKASLRQGFENSTDKQNTAIHEFVHLIDKTDGEVDGVPESLLGKKYILPWLDLMHRNLKEMSERHSDINPYGATSQAEFFAVVAEYFFERPDLLESKHPDLYAMLKKMFLQDPAASLTPEIKHK